jgi:hypothetical protein
MKRAVKSLGLVFLLILAQQGAVVHELSHVSRANDAAALKVESGGVADSTCALCPAFAQAATPAFSYSFQLPLLLRAAAQLVAEPQFPPVLAAVPTPRSRGPPSLS